MSSKDGAYPTQRRLTIAEAPGLRVRLLALGRGQNVPWHYHSDITDTFFCMEGPMRVVTHNPDAEHILYPGGTCAVGPRIAHYVSGVDAQACKFMLIQGVGTYDYVPVDE